jgi:hypothetical protein
MNKTARTIAVNGLGLVVFAIVVYLFVWPALAPYITLPSLFPEKHEIASVAVNKDSNGKWFATVKYVYGGKVEGARLSVSQYELPGDKDPLPPQILTSGTGRGENFAKIEIQRPGVAEAVKVTRVGVALSFRGGQPLAYKEVPVSIEWPDRETANFEQEVASIPVEEAQARLKSLMAAGDTPSMLHAKGIAKALLRSDPNSATASQAMVFVQTHAIWTPEGISRIDALEKMWTEILAMENAHAFSTLDELAGNLRDTKSLMPGGASKLSVFYDAASKGWRDASMTPQAWKNSDDYLKSWVKVRPESVVAKILRMKMLSSQAWQIRGGGAASTVSSEQWVRFHLLTEQAIAHGEACRPACESDPDWYATMISLLIDHSTTDERIGPLFAEGLQRFPDYDPIFVNAGRKFTPRWGGSPEGFERFARQLASQYSPPRGDEVYAILYGHVTTYGDAFESPPVSQWAADCPRWIRGLRSRTSRHPTDAAINFAAYVSAQCGDKRSTQAYLKQIAGKPDLHEWGWNPEKAAREFARVQAWAR